MANSGAKRDNSVHSVDRAVSVLQVLARRGPTPITEIAAELGLHKSTVFRLLSTLEGRGLVDQNTSRGRYQLGYGVVQLAAGVTRRLDLAVVSRPVCVALAEQVGDTVNIAILDGDATVSIDQVMGSSAVTTVNWVGQRDPLHVASAGKVMLAHLAPDRRAAYLRGPLPQFTAKTITDPVELGQQLDDVLELGYGFTLEERELGLAAVAAPIRSLDGQVVAAVAVSGPTARINAETIPAVAAQVLAAATEISQRIGQPKPG